MKDLLARYSLWIGIGSLLIALGAGAHSCSGTIFGAGSTLAGKAEASRVSALEAQMGRLQECIEGIKTRQDRAEKKMDRLEGKIDRLLERRP